MLIHKSLIPKNKITNFQLLESYVYAGFNYGNKYLKNVSNNLNPKGLRGARNEMEKLLKENLTDGSQVLTMSPLHTDQIKFVKKEDLNALRDDENGIGKFIECDAIITDYDKLILCVKPGDCTITVGYAWNKTAKYTFLIHAGRKGLTLNIIGLTIQKLINEFDINPENIIVSVTPSLFENNYLLYWGDDHMKSVWNKFHEKINDRIYLKSLELLKCQLKNSGVLDGKIEIYEVDTYNEAKNGNSFSHRYSTENNLMDGRFLTFTKLK